MWFALVARQQRTLDRLNTVFDGLASEITQSPGRTSLTRNALWCSTHEASFLLSNAKSVLNPRGQGVSNEAGVIMWEGVSSLLDAFDQPLAKLLILYNTACGTHECLADNMLWFDCRSEYLGSHRCDDSLTFIMSTSASKSG